MRITPAVRLTPFGLVGLVALMGCQRETDVGSLCDGGRCERSSLVLDPKSRAFIERAAALLCASAEECCRDVGEGFDASECPYPDELLAAFSQRVQINTEPMEACLRELEQEVAEGCVSSFEVGECRDILTGKLGINEPCEDTRECILEWRGEQVGCERGLCLPLLPTWGEIHWLPELGDRCVADCDHARCALSRGAICDPDEPLSCLGICDRDAGHYCSEDGRCELLRSRGEACDQDDACGWPDVELYCKEGVCAGLEAVGQPCVPARVMCVAGAYCDDGTCAPPLQQGDPCDEDDWCQDGEDYDVECVDGTCERVPYPWSTTCEPGGTCKSVPPEREGALGGLCMPPGRD